ncbi:periphilin-1 isoform X8 [Dasypus novemcinctus]|uniref:periphilin-1 isoform X8 n=1 Tax=Dasypus novemcinctus TaxID=9361 RepID=UPI00265F1B61|nr:periphilin-1 isoform X6 [Dasypus novemcinctus]
MLHIPVILGSRRRLAYRRDEMWSEGRYDYERLPRERLPPRSHPSDESSYRWPRDDHSASRQPEYRDVRDGFRRKSFYSSHYARDRSPHKRDNSYLRESPVGRKDSPHSRSGSSVSSRSYSPERSKTYSFHQSQHRKSVRAGASYKRQNEGKPERGKERPLQAMKTSGDTSPSSSSAVTSSKVLDKPSRLTEKELAEAASKWAAEKVEKGDESNLPEISEYEPVSVARVLQLSSVVLASCDPTKPPEASTGAQRGARAPLAREQKMPHNQSGSPAGTSDQPLPQHRLTRKERRHLRATLHKMRKASLTERDDKDNILRLYYQAKTIQHRNPSKPPGIVPLLVIMLSLAASGQASMAGSTAPLFIDQPEEPESNAKDGIELFEDSQLTSRSKAIASKTKEIEQVYRQDCETFGMVVKMLIEKDPSLEKSIQFALRQNLHEIGERCVEELKHFIAEYDTSSPDFGEPF